MALTNEQIERYSRHIILKEVGVKGQKKLLGAKVLIIGAGGLGAPAGMYLAAAGVGTIGIADADEVDLSNLQRQIIHQTADIGKPYLDCISAAARDYAKTIFDTLRRYEYNPDLMRLFIVGGGGCVIKNFGDYDRDRVTIIEDICATAKGYEHLAYMALRKRGYLTAKN